MSRVLPFPFKVMFLFLEPVATLLGAYSAFAAPEWYLTSLLPGPTVSGLLHTTETIFAIRLYGVLLMLLALISLAVFPVVANKTDATSFSVARRLFFVLAFGDVVHIWVSVVHLGEKVVMDPGSWNDMTWGNIGITAVLLASRTAWFLTVGLKKVDDSKKIQ